MLKFPKRTMFGLLSQALSIIGTKSSNQGCVAVGISRGVDEEGR